MSWHCLSSQTENACIASSKCHKPDLLLLITIAGTDDLLGKHALGISYLICNKSNFTSVSPEPIETTESSTAVS